MFRFMKKAFLVGLTVLSTLIGVNSLSCILMTNQECSEPVFYPFSIKTSKCSGSCNNINDPYAKMCVPDNVKNLNARVFNLMSRSNETRHMERHETCECTCKLDASVSNNKQRCNDDKCRCECKELIDKSVCDEGFIWNPSNCECKYDKTCNVGEYLDYENCKCRKKLVDKLTEECTENVDEVKIASENKHKNKCSSCTLYIVLFSIIFTINIGIVTYFIYRECMYRNEENASRYDDVYETKDY